MSNAADIKLAVEKTAGCPVTHVETVPIVETFRGQTIWEGTVETYALAKPPPAHAYGWAVKGPEGSGTQFVAVLGNPPTNSPLAAVRAWLVSLAKK